MRNFRCRFADLKRRDADPRLSSLSDLDLLRHEVTRLISECRNGPRGALCFDWLIDAIVLFVESDPSFAELAEEVRRIRSAGKFGRIPDRFYDDLTRLLSGIDTGQ